MQATLTLTVISFLNSFEISKKCFIFQISNLKSAAQMWVSLESEYLTIKLNSFSDRFVQENKLLKI
jgi:hypothetical protein